MKEATHDIIREVKKAQRDVSTSLKHPLIGANVMNDSTSNPSVIQIPLFGIHVILISKEDEDLTAFKWTASYQRGARRYAFTTNMKEYSGKSQTLMHRVILERKLGKRLYTHEYVDHINGNTLDNRRENLRIASPLQNAHNSKRPSSNTSGYKGVTRLNGKWCARITSNGKVYHLGMYSNLKDAARAYNIAAIKYHGEFAYLNVIEEDNHE